MLVLPILRHFCGFAWHSCQDMWWLHQSCNKNSKYNQQATYFHKHRKDFGNPSHSGTCACLFPYTRIIKNRLALALGGDGVLGVDHAAGSAYLIARATT